MKRLVHILALPLLLASGTAAAQFTTEADTVKIVVEDNLDAHNNITNTSAANIQIEWRVTGSDFPTEWRDSARLGICDNALCRQNGSNSLLNGTMYTSMDYVPSVKGDFHVQLVGFADAAVAPGTHYISVELKEKGGTAQKDIVFVFTKFPTNVGNSINKSADEILLYPNPAHNYLNVSYGKKLGVKTIALYGILGNQLVNYKVSASSAKLDVEKLPTGLYFIRLIDNNGQVVATRRFTRQ